MKKMAGVAMGLVAFVPAATVLLKAKPVAAKPLDCANCHWVCVYNQRCFQCFEADGVTFCYQTCQPLGSC